MKVAWSEWSFGLSLRQFRKLSDAQVTMGSSAPRWYRKAFEHRCCSRNNRVMRLWLEGLADPIFEVRHRHDANWSWW
jgi:hypothetical protein